LGKIAVLLDDACGERERLGAEPGLAVRTLSAGDGWAVEDVVCTYRPSDASFEERHACYRVALVGAGTFNCRGPHGRELLTPGSLLLGNAGEGFECGHEHGTGDRCLAFAYSPEMFERLAFDAGVRGKPRLAALRVPPIRELAPLVAEASAVWASASPQIADELAVCLAAAADACGADACPRSPRNAERGVVAPCGSSSGTSQARADASRARRPEGVTSGVARDRPHAAPLPRARLRRAAVGS
jgi:hypothetical protein